MYTLGIYGPNVLNFKVQKVYIYTFLNFGWLITEIAPRIILSSVSDWGKMVRFSYPWSKMYGFKS